MTDEGTATELEQTPKTETVAVEPPARLPDDHPLVTALAALKAENLDLKKQATELADLRNADAAKTDQIQALQTELAEVKLANLRHMVANKHRILAEDAERVLTGTTEEALNEQAEWFTKRLGDTAGYVPLLGQVVTEKSTSPEAQFADFRANLRK